MAIVDPSAWALEIRSLFPSAFDVRVVPLACVIRGDREVWPFVGV
jgi:hypothetical protein